MHVVMAFILGVLLGFLIGAIIATESDIYRVGAKESIAQCEASLPRDQHCVAVITAKPKAK